jgi:hypothetical protein
VRNVTERKMGNKHLLEACKDKHVNAGRARKSDGKMCSKHLLEVWEALFKYDEKGREKGEEGEESDGKKEGSICIY